ncbi:MAG: hypothetical protein LBH75_06520 [Treponema sp.]|jgi:hypothetical protein|nr:hypothetical protein [Treponema sp.]
MASSDDFISAGDAEFNGKFRVLVAYVVEKTSGASPAWTHIPRIALDGLERQYALWQTAYKRVLGPHTSVDTEAKNQARRETAAFIRPFIGQYLKFPPVTDEDRVAMGVHNRKKRSAFIPAPHTRPIITDLYTLGGGRVKIRFSDETTSNSRAIPHGMNGCLFFFTIGPERVRDCAALTQIKLLTRSPYTLIFPPSMQVNFLSCAVRWQNRRGVIGPLSDVYHTVIS